uniref:Elongation of fatty acids protein n=1 Tax=Arcella intermedia TaxID=1963864 RepID=A0A6B2LGB2_9EUKA
MLSISAMYVVTAVLGRQVMKDKPAVNLGHFSKAYNFIQVILSVYMAWGIFGPGGLKSKLFGINDEHTQQLEYFVWIHYWSKMLDFVDTLMIVLKKNDRQFTFLHVYHHGSIVAIWGYLLYAGVGTGTTAFGAGLNSIIHAIMYSHYFIVSIGLHNPFKKYITTAQLVQFVLCIIHSLAVAAFETSTVQPFWWIQFVYQCSMFYLFMDFFKKNYSAEKNEGDQKEKTLRRRKAE